MNISFNNYNKVSNKIAKRIGDICLFSIPIYIPIILELPIKDSIKTWLISSLSFIMATVKIISKFTTDNVNADV